MDHRRKNPAAAYRRPITSLLHGSGVAILLLALGPSFGVAAARPSLMENTSADARRQ